MERKGDTNVLLDFLLVRHEEAVHIARIIEQIENGILKGYLTLSIIQIIGYWLTKEWGRKRAGKGLLVLLNHFEIPGGNKDVSISALSSPMIDIEDALQYYTGIHHQIDAVISRDKRFIKSALQALPVYNPGNFVRKFLAG